jgi:steroid delta-isomerase-like uncharacterized protein
MGNFNKNLAQRAVEKVWNQADRSLAEEIYAEDFLSHSEIGNSHGPEEFMEYLSGFREAFPDLTFRVMDVIGEGDRVAVRWRARGTHKGDFQGISPTGEQYETTGITIFLIENEKIVEDWGEWDRLSLMQQLGAIPELEQMMS